MDRFPYWQRTKKMGKQSHHVNIIDIIFSFVNNVSEIIAELSICPYVFCRAKRFICAAGQIIL